MGMSPEGEVRCPGEPPLCNTLPERKEQYAFFVWVLAVLMGKHQRCKVAVWSPPQQTAETAEGEGKSSRFAELKAIQLALDIAE